MAFITEIKPYQNIKKEILNDIDKMVNHSANQYRVKTASEREIYKTYIDKLSVELQNIEISRKGVKEEEITIPFNEAETRGRPSKVEAKKQKDEEMYELYEYLDKLRDVYYQSVKESRCSDVFYDGDAQNLPDEPNNYRPSNKDRILSEEAREKQIIGKRKQVNNQY
jgi:hypothetical protein